MSGNNFTIETGADNPQYLLLRLHGVLDGHSASKLMEASGRAAVGRRRLILNLSGIEIVTSSGIGVLLALVAERDQEFEQVRVAAPSEAVAAVIRLLNLDQFLTLDETEAQSIGAAEAA